MKACHLAISQFALFAYLSAVLLVLCASFIGLGFFTLIISTFSLGVMAHVFFISFLLGLLGYRDISLQSFTFFAVLFYRNLMQLTAHWVDRSVCT